MHDVVITGIGLVSSLAEGADANYARLREGAAPVYDREAIAPFPIHAPPPLDYGKLIPKKSDQRQMEPWQRLGVYAAGLALQDAGLLGNTAILPKVHMIVAAGGGERDIAVDEGIMTGIRAANDRGAYLNEQLSKNLRPTLFLAQLPNLLAGNISIIHGVTGSSRTFMGEEAAGLDALGAMVARIRAGDVDVGLVGRRLFGVASGYVARLRLRRIALLGRARGRLVARAARRRHDPRIGRRFPLAGIARPCAGARRPHRVGHRAGAVGSQQSRARGRDRQCPKIVVDDGRRPSRRVRWASCPARPASSRSPPRNGRFSSDVGAGREHLRPGDGRPDRTQHGGGGAGQCRARGAGLARSGLFPAVRRRRPSSARPPSRHRRSS